MTRFKIETETKTPGVLLYTSTAMKIMEYIV